MDDVTFMRALLNTADMAERLERAERLDRHLFNADVLHDCVTLLREASERFAESATLTFEATDDSEPASPAISPGEAR